MLATKISFMNEMANLAELFGADIEKCAKRPSVQTRVSVISLSILVAAMVVHVSPKMCKP